MATSAGKKAWKNKRQLFKAFSSRGGKTKKNITVDGIEYAFLREQCNVANNGLMLKLRGYKKYCSKFSNSNLNRQHSMFLAQGEDFFLSVTIMVKHKWWLFGKSN